MDSNLGQHRNKRAHTIIRPVGRRREQLLYEYSYDYIGHVLHLYDSRVDCNVDANLSQHGDRQAQYIAHGSNIMRSVGRHRELLRKSYSYFGHVLYP